MTGPLAVEPVQLDGEGNSRHVALEGAAEQLQEHMKWWHGAFLGIPRLGRGPHRRKPIEPTHVLNVHKESKTGDHAPSEL